MEESIREAVTEAMTLLTTYGLDVIGAIAILVIGWLLSGWARRAVDRGLSKFDKFDVTLRTFFASLAKYLVIIITVVAVLNQFGVQTASLIAVLGAAGLAIGLALQGTLSNVAAGVMLLIFRPFRVGDFIEAGGISGTVKAVTLFVTELATPDNVHIVAPNAQLWGTAVKNYSFHPTRRVDFVLGIAYEDSMDQAITAVRAVIDADSRALKDPEPMVVVSELADSSVNLTIRIWVNAADYWPLKFDLTKAFKERLDAEGISIPYPQRSVHMASGGSEKIAAEAAE